MKNRKVLCTRCNKSFEVDILKDQCVISRNCGPRDLVQCKCPECGEMVEIPLDDKVRNQIDQVYEEIFN